MTIKRFYPNEDFDKYVENLLQYFCAENINDDKEKIRFLFQFAGYELEQVIKSAVPEKGQSEMNFKQITKLLSKHFNKKRNVRAERYAFYTRKIRPNENLKDFIEAIKYLAAACDFGNFLDSMLCDKLIWSQKDVDMRNKLIEVPIKAKFDQMCKIALGEQITDVCQLDESISIPFAKINLVNNNKVQEKRNKIPLEEILKQVNQFITLDPVDRRQYGEDYNNIKNYIMNECKRVCPTFNQMFKGDILCGSCADNLKITKPNEFDLIFQLKLPLVKHVRRKNIKEIPGFVKINISKMLEEISKLKEYEAVYKKLLSLVDVNKFLVQQKVSSWMEGIMTEVIPKDGQIRLLYKGNIEKCYKVQYTKCGPAHTLRIIQENEFSIDFVPGFVFDKTYWVAQRPYPSEAKNINWHAIPKPDRAKPVNEPNFYFITSYVPIESEFIENKQKLKNAMRLLKKIRDKCKTELLKSYFIKTVFLWETTKQPDEFWCNQSLADVFMHMFEVLLQYIQKKELPSFWDEDFNMFEKFTINQMTAMFGPLNKVRESIKKHLSSSPDELYKVFLNKQELEELFKKSSGTRRDIKSHHSML